MNVKKGNAVFVEQVYGYSSKIKNWEDCEWANTRWSKLEYIVDTPLKKGKCAKKKYVENYTYSVLW